MKAPFFALAALALLAPLGSAQSILSVDAGGGGDFLDIQAAVDAANPWDVVLVKAGTYTGFTVEAKSLVVAADANELVTLTTPTTVFNLASGDEVVLQGLTLQPPNPGIVFSAISVLDCAGHVLLQELDAELSAGGVALLGLAYIRDCAAVAIVNSRFDSSTSNPAGALGTLLCENSEVFLHGVVASGAKGADGFLTSPDGFGGGAGLELRGGTVLAVDCEFEGGNGGNGSIAANPGNGGDGGPGVLMTGMMSSVPELTIYDSLLVPGAGGTALAPGMDGDTGVPTEVLAGTITTPAAFARSFTAAPVVRVGELTTLTFTGQPFDLAWHIIGFDTNATTVYLPDVLGAFHPGGTPLLFQYRGLLNGNGKKNLTFTLQPTGLDYVPVYEQALMYNPTEGFVASNPVFVAFFDSTVP